jgi:hypothetical protein
MIPVREVFLSLASPEMVSWAGFVMLAVALLGEVGVYFIHPKREALHGACVFGFAALAVIGYVVERIGDDAVLKRFAPRDLSSIQETAVTDAVRGFGGQKYSVSIAQGIDDGCSFWKTLHSVLESAHWAYDALKPNDLGACDPPAGIPIVSEPGVSVFVHREKENEIGRAAVSLASALTTQGIKATAILSPYATTNADELITLAIVIGARVPP